MRAGVAVRPDTPIEALAAALRATPALTLALVMTVAPGFGGQPFRADAPPRIAALRAEFPALDIQVDGGLDARTVVGAAAAGANVIVAGTSVFRAPDAAAAIAGLRAAVVAAAAADA
jgi:ribulose-phosphate 3-epimerase